MSQSEPIINVDGLTKTYSGKNVVDGVSFEVKKGEIFGILGPNGAGKTTTLEMLEVTVKSFQGLRNGTQIQVFSLVRKS